MAVSEITLEERFPWFRSEKCTICNCKMRSLSVSYTLLSQHEQGRNHQHNNEQRQQQESEGQQRRCQRVEFTGPQRGMLYLVVHFPGAITQNDKLRTVLSNNVAVYGPLRTRTEVEDLFDRNFAGLVISAVCTSTPLRHPNVRLPPRNITQPRTSGNKPYLTRIPYVLDLPPFPVPRRLLDHIGTTKLEAEFLRVDLDNAAKVYLNEVWGMPPPHYRERMHAVLFVEEAEETNSLHRYDIDRAVFVPHPKEQLLVLKVAGLAEKRPSVLRGDTIIASNPSSGERHTGFVHFVNLEDVSISFGHHMPSGEMTVEFVVKRSDFRILHRCIDATDMFLDQYLAVPFAGASSHVPVVGCSMRHSTLAQHAAQLNPEQKSFIARCFEPSSTQLQVLWGPPGTGKTTTVVAYIKCLVAARQQVSAGSGEFILVCTPSNAASDQLTERLATVLTPNEMLRVVAPGRLQRDTPERIRAYTTPEGALNQGHVMATESQIRAKWVIVVTLGTAGRLYACHPWLRKRVAYLVVDEAGQATDVLMCAALQFCDAAFTRSVLLAGDPKQLGPVVQSQAAKMYGMNISPLSRLLGIPTVRDKCFFQLIENYRSHPDILRLVNIFYDDLLVAPKTGGKWSPAIRGSRITLIHSKSLESYEADSPSIMNHGEMNAVMDRVEQLMREEGAKAEDIVILSPYLKQAQKLNQWVHRRVEWERRTDFRGLRAVTVEAFQGQEARHIILTCVRSVENDDRIIAADIRRYLGFLKQESRVNVAISRAIDTLTIVGNFSLLMRDPTWERLIRRAVVDMGVPVRSAQFTPAFVLPAVVAAPITVVTSAATEDEEGIPYEDAEASVVRLE